MEFLRSFWGVEERRGGEKLKFEKKTIALILAVTIGLSLFVGLASAAGNKDIVSQILEIVLGIDTKVDGIITDMGKTTMMLGSYIGHFVSTSAGDGVIEGARITSDKPAIFTVTLSLSGYKDAADTVWLAQAPNKWFWATAAGRPLSGENDDMTFTVAGYGVVLTYRDYTPANLEVVYCIVVQGEKGTVVKVGPWTS